MCYYDVKYSRYVYNLSENDPMTDVLWKIDNWLNDFARRCGIKTTINDNDGWNVRTFTKNNENTRFYFLFDVQLENGIVIKYSVSYDRKLDNYFIYINIGEKVFLKKNKAIEFVKKIRDVE